jgi:serine/threonine protein kinase
MKWKMQKKFVLFYGFLIISNYFKLFQKWFDCSAVFFVFSKRRSFFKRQKKTAPCFLTSSKCTLGKLVSHIKGVFPSIILGDFDSANRTFRFSAGVTMDRYQKIEKNGHVGEGTYGVVYKAKDKQTDAIVALKVLDATTAYEGTPILLDNNV